MLILKVTSIIGNIIDSAFEISNENIKQVSFYLNCYITKFEQQG